ncbi:MAG TPA: TRAP transporter substrate-binding protein DctP [Polyangia bacterium]|nr:TRAP transporter substrate-binding protein DctP [Polyangia bacterium]
MAAIAPDGTAWAHEIRAFSRDVEAQSHGQVHLKWYLGGIAGDELTALDRVRHGQLDGLAGASFCDRVAPSLSVIRIAGLFESRDEVAFVLGRLKPLIDEEARRGGFANLADSVFGADLIFSRRPVRTMAQLAATRWWMWDRSPVWLRMMAALQWHPQASSVDDLAPLYDSGAVDGFMVPPGAALAYQWSTMAVYFTPLETAWLPGCVMISNAAMDPLSLDQQRAIRSAAAKFRLRWNDTTEQLDRALVDGLFQKQGLQRVAVTPQLRADFAAAMKVARAKLSEPLVPAASLTQVEKLLDEYRANRSQSSASDHH